MQTPDRKPLSRVVKWSMIHPTFIWDLTTDPRVLTKDFTPYSAKDAARMTRKQVKFCKSLSDEAKSLIRLRQSQVFKYGKVLSALLAAPIALDSATAACSQDPFFCIDTMSEILDNYAIDHGIPLNHPPNTTDPNP